nr:hypothetical protein [uncultured Flavobacterium sp.]
MKTKTYWSVLLATGLLFVSCKKEETVETAAKPVPSVYEILNGNKVATPPPTPPVQVQQNTTAVPQTVTTTQTAPTPVAVGKGMNPSHGQPGHRCDIPVGAPLNSPPGKTAVKTQPAPGKAIVTQTTIPSTPTTNNSGVPALLNSPTPVTTAPGMNPPHGQAGHRCDIAVGAPLNKTEEKKDEKIEEKKVEEKKE